ncbi:MAG: tRNA pseudouridine(55) synthase TruB [Candidatus Limnocylindrales bacterium]
MSGADRPGLDGILVVAKPAGPTSHDIVALVRRLAATKRVGHGGTLDPFATGVLPLFLGRATRLVEYHLTDRKAYRATICFGASSTTDDLEGALTPAAGSAPDRATVEAALAAQLGPISQVPPADSAIKLGGRRAYALARAGEAPVMKPRAVTIDRLELIDWDGTDPDRPIAIVEVDCSAGTYVRSLARDVGLAVGSAAYLGALIRTGSGGFGIDRAHSLEAIRAATEAGPDRLVQLLLPLDTGLESFPRVTLSETEVAAVGRGQFVRPAAALPAIEPGGRLLAVDGTARVVAIGVVREGRFAPDKVLVEPTAPVAAASPA